MTRINLSHSPRFGSNTNPPLYLSRFPFAFVFFPPSPSSSFSSAFAKASTFLPHCLSGQMYLRRWNSCSKMYSLRSARPPLSVLFLRYSTVQPHHYFDLNTRSLHIPRVPSEVRQLPRQRQHLHLRRQRHLVMRIELTMPHKCQQPVRMAHAPVKVRCRVVRVDVLPVAVQVRLAHLGERPRRRRYHSLRIVNH